MLNPTCLWAWIVCPHGFHPSRAQVMPWPPWPLPMAACWAAEAKGPLGRLGRRGQGRSCEMGREEMAGRPCTSPQCHPGDPIVMRPPTKGALRHGLSWSREMTSGLRNVHETEVAWSVPIRFTCKLSQRPSCQHSYLSNWNVVFWAGLMPQSLF